ncbi:hypothetical protein HDF23_004796 [Mucilaginibacter lappiensis]|uniref:Uncharacterized protein n=1 Tax=Mucilaginibacter lappiensis TaxID=354630 RepID=A0ABR6PQG5_9SPHI|nr:hypothetical protein [Mucilaginibacter lappiensis]MBB6112023.1 hypothetical protein [Mucilaginibacter lappiensis]
MSRKAVHIMVLSIGMLMLLIRPYLVYQLIGYEIKDKNPVKTRLLQRLIKKKEDHFECYEQAAAEIRGKKFCFRLPVTPVPSFQFQKLHPAAGFCLAAFAEMAAGILLIRRGNHRYCLLSCFRI